MFEDMAKTARKASKQAAKISSQQTNEEAAWQWLEISQRWDYLANAYDNLDLPDRPAVPAEYKLFIPVVPRKSVPK